MNYYKNELNKLVNSEYGISIKLTDSQGNATKTIRLYTNESIDTLREYINNLQNENAKLRIDNIHEYVDNLKQN